LEVGRDFPAGTNNVLNCPERPGGARIRSDAAWEWGRERRAPDRESARLARRNKKPRPSSLREQIERMKEFKHPEALQ